MIDAVGDWFSRPSRSELKQQISDLQENLRSANRTIAHKSTAITLLQKNLEEKTMSSGADVVDNVPLNKDAGFFIKQSRPDKEKDFFVTNGGRGTYEKTLKYAEELAAQYPQNTYTVIGPVATVKASVPIITTILADIKSQEKVDTSKG
jgi:hypothetical protein